MNESLFSPKQTITFPVVEAIGQDSSKYLNREKNIEESERRLRLIPQLSIYAQAICDDLNIERVSLKACGSAEQGYASSSSDLDVVITVNKQHPLATNRETRKEFSAKMQLLVRATKEAIFPVNFLILVT